MFVQVGKKGSQRGQFNLISSVAASPNDDILVADSRIQIFSSEGEFKREIFSEGKGLCSFLIFKIYLLLILITSLQLQFAIKYKNLTYVEV